MADDGINLPQGIRTAVKTFAALVTLVAFAALSCITIRDVTQTGAGGPPTYSDWVTYLSTAVAAFVGGVVAVAFGQAAPTPPPPPDPSSQGSGTAYEPVAASRTVVTDAGTRANASYEQARRYGQRKLEKLGKCRVVRPNYACSHSNRLGLRLPFSRNSSGDRLGIQPGRNVNRCEESRGHRRRTTDSHRTGIFFATE